MPDCIVKTEQSTADSTEGNEQIAEVKDSGIKFWSFWDNNQLIGCAALKFLDDEHGEFKSIRVSDKFRKKGKGKIIFYQLIDCLLYTSDAADE